MPTYEYRCKFCHQVSDAFQRMSDAPLLKCAHCGKDGLERVVSGGAGVIYKGEGWYVTDYSKKSSGGRETEGKSQTKSDASKPDAAKPDAAKLNSPKPDTPKTETTSAETKSTDPISK